MNSARWQAGRRPERLPVIDSAGVCVGEPEISAASDAAVREESRAIVVAGRGALKLVNGAKLGGRTSERVNAGWPRARQRTGELPSRERIDGVIAAVESRTGGVEDRIRERDWLRKVHVEGADEMLSADLQQGERDSRRLATSFSMVKLDCCTRGVTKFGAKAETV
jgi:hypothetical protein